MKKRIACVLFTLLLGCSDDVLHRVCGNIGGQCYAVWTDKYHDPQLTSQWQASRYMELAEKGELQGICKLGTPTCDASGDIIDCQGAVYPDVEVCDGIDNDCEYGVDNINYYGYASNHSDSTCVSGLGVCRVATLECTNGQIVCNYPDTYEAGEEASCDNLDNDCDGRIDEDLGNQELCYDAEFWTATNGQCRPGVTRCIHGQMQCDGQVLPSLELCDSIDNDCNGIIDDTGDTLSQKYDIVFNVDTSGSMCSYIAAVAAALDAYVEQFEGNANFRFAIVIMSRSTGGLVGVDTNFTDLGTIRSRLLNLGCSGSGSEASLDSMAMVCDEQNPLNLDWNTEANRLFFTFTDEPAQTYSSPQTTAQDIVDNCLVSGTLPFIWSRGSPDFTYVVNNANGIEFTLVNDWATIFDDMNSIVITLCGS